MYQLPAVKMVHRESAPFSPKMCYRYFGTFPCTFPVQKGTNIRPGIKNKFGNLDLSGEK